MWGRWQGKVLSVRGVPGVAEDVFYGTLALVLLLQHPLVMVVVITWVRLEYHTTLP